MLKIIVDEIPEGISYQNLRCEPSDIELDSDEDFYFSGPVFVNLGLYRQINSIFIKFNMTVEVESECFRCLSKVHLILNAKSEVQYKPLPKLEHDRIYDIGIGYYHDDYIDLTDEVRESLLLELPMTVLCSEDCKGLCQHCGKNKNIGECNCSKDEDSHISKFAELIRTLDIKKKLEV